MRITYSPDADALYVELRADATVARTEQIGPGLNIDFDPDGRLIGLEVLSASAHVPAEELAAAESPVAWLTLAKAAEEAARMGEPIAPATLRSQVAKGKLTAEKRGRDLYVARHELLNYLERRAPSGRRAKVTKVMSFNAPERVQVGAIAAMRSPPGPGVDPAPPRDAKPAGGKPKRRPRGRARR